MLRFNGSQRNENQDNSELLLSTHQRANTDKEATTHAVGKGDRYSPHLLMGASGGWASYGWSRVFTLDRSRKQEQP